MTVRGIGAGALDHRVRRGQLQVVYRGVYSLGRASTLRKQGHWMAAVLACGDGAVLSHAAAAALWDLRPSAASVVDVTVPAYAGRAHRSGIRVHRSATLDDGQRTVHDAIPVTSVPRTLIDLADRFDRRTLERALDQAEVLRLLDLVGLESTIEANRGRHGSGVLAELLRGRRIGEDLTGSELEDEFLRLCDRYAIPRPEIQVPLAGRRIDFLWREQRLAVEVDGWRWHGGVAARERDHERDVALQRLGLRIMHVTARRILANAESLANDVLALLRS